MIKVGEAVVQPPAAGGSRLARMRLTGVQHVTGDNHSAARFRCRESWVIAQSLVLTQPDDNGGIQVLKSRVKRRQTGRVVKGKTFKRMVYSQRQ